MATPRVDRLHQRSDMPVAPDEDPFVLAQGGFYRRWLSLVTDVDELRTGVEGVTATTDDHWVPHWSAIARRHEEEGDRREAAGDLAAAGREFLEAKTYYSLARFPGPITPLKERAHADCIRAYRKATAHLHPPLRAVAVECGGRTIPCHFRHPPGASAAHPVPAVLVMCGADMFKEDRGWALEFALDHQMACLVMDAPGTGENPFPHEPDSVVAWLAAVDWLAERPEVDAGRIGAVGISRGGYSVMQLAGTAPDRIGAVVAAAGHYFGYEMGPEEAETYVAVRNARSAHIFGAPGDGPTFAPTSVEEEAAALATWSLAEQGLVDRITMPTLMINGKRDHLAPIGNIYWMLEHGPATGKEARVYPDDGHCAPRHRHEWVPAAFAWMAERLRD